MPEEQPPDEVEPPAFLSPDEAIQSSREDELGRVPFAREIAEAIASWKNNSSLVFALVGPWGNGKSSIKNLVVEALEKRNSPARPAVLQFVPWEWAAQGRILAAFFEELAATLKMTDNTRAGEERAAKLVEYGELLQGTAGGLGGFPAFLATLVAAIGALGVSTFTTGPAKIALQAFTLLCIAAAFLLALLGGALTAVGKFQTLRFARRGETLPQRKQKLSDLMGSALPVSPVLVVMDDLDRLDAQELLQVIQLIRANADLPNLVYLLLYEEDIVSRTLDSVYEGNGREAMKKIVNIPLPTPEVQPGQLQQLAKRRVEEVIGNRHHELNDLRWANIVASGWGDLIDNIRTIKLFLNIYALHVRMLTSGTVLEVDPGDLAAIDLLRVTEPALYAALPAAKDWLTSDTRSQQKEIRQESFRHLVGLAREKHRDAVSTLLKRLFPPIESFMGSLLGGATIHSNDQYREWWINRLVCSRLAFDIYFTLTTPTDEASGSQVQTLAKSLNEEDAFVGRLRELSRAGVVRSALRQLDSDQVPVGTIPTFLRGLFRAGDEFLSTKTQIPGLPPDEWAAVYAIRTLCRTRLSEKDYAGAVLAAMEGSGAVYLPTVLTSWESDPQSPLGQLSAETLGALREACLNAIREAASSDKLLEIPSLAYVLYRWKDWGDPQDVQGWLRQHVKTVQDIKDWAIRLGGYRSAGPITDPVHRLTFIPAYGDLANLIGRDYLDEITGADGLPPVSQWPD